MHRYALPCQAGGYIRVTSGEIVPISTTTLPGRAAEASPCGAKNDGLPTSDVSGNHDKMMSARRAIACGLSAPRALASVNGAIDSAPRMHAVDSRYAADSRPSATPRRPIQQSPVRENRSGVSVEVKRASHVDLRWPTVFSR